MDLNALLQFFRGLLNNYLYVSLASIVPVAAGIGLSFAMKAIKAKGVRIMMRVMGALFYCLVPLVLLIVLYYSLRLASDTTFVIVLSLSISHLGYFAVRYDNNASVGKNIVVNLFGVLSSLFLWSVASAYIVGGYDIFAVCKSMYGSHYLTSSFVITLVVCFLNLAALNVPRMILKETMK